MQASDSVNFRSENDSSYPKSACGLEIWICYKVPGVDQEQEENATVTVKLTAACVFLSLDGIHLLTAPHGFRYKGDTEDCDDSDSDSDSDSDFGFNFGNNTAWEETDTSERPSSRSSFSASSASLPACSPEPRHETSLTTQPTSYKLRVIPHWKAPDKADVGLVNISSEFLDTLTEQSVWGWDDKPGRCRGMSFVNLVDVPKSNDTGLHTAYVTAFSDNSEWMTTESDQILRLDNSNRPAHAAFSHDLCVQTRRGALKAVFMNLVFEPQRACIQLTEDIFGMSASGH